MNTNLKKMLVPFYTTLGDNSHFKYTKLKREKKNCSIAKFPSFYRHFTPPVEQRQEEERPIPYR